MYGDDFLISGVLLFDLIIICISMIINVVFGCGYCNLGIFVGVGGFMGFG